MRRICLSLVLLIFVKSALADSTIDALSPGAALTGTEAIPMFQTANPAVKTTTNAISAFISSRGVTPAAGTCVMVAGWNVCAPTGLTTSEADTAMLVTAFANAKAAPVWLSPGVYYSCGVSALPDVVRGGVVGGPAAWIGVGAPGSAIIRPWPYIPSLVYCNNNAATGPMIHVHDGTVLFGFGIQGNTGLGGTPSMDCVSAINTVSHSEHDMQYIGCGTPYVSSTTTTGAVDVGSSSTPGDQGTLTQGGSFTHIACFYGGHCFVGLQGGGNGTTDMKWNDIECEVPDDTCFYMQDLSQSQINLLRSEDAAAALQVTLSGPLVVTNTYCHLVSGGCIVASVYPGAPATLQIIGFVNNSVITSPDIQVTDSSTAGSQMELFITNTLGGNGFGSLQYVPNSATSKTVIVDTTVLAFDTTTKSVILNTPSGGADAEFTQFGYGYTLAAGTLQLPSCVTGLLGKLKIVTDYNTTYPAVDTTLTPGTAGSGTTGVRAVCNGTNWKSR